MPDPANAAPAPEPVVETPVPAAPVIATEVDIPDDGGFPAPEPEPAPEPPKAADAPPAEEPKPAIKKSPYQARIDTLTAQREAEKKRADDAIKEAELYRAIAEGKAADAPPGDTPPASAPKSFATQAEFDKAVREHAAQLSAQESAKAKTDTLLASGNTEYRDFTDRCNVVASLGAGDRPDFMQIVTDPTVIPDGHKVIAQLAENPDEAARILALPTVQMTAALVKFQAEQSKAPPPADISKVPPPIRPIDGQSRGSDEPKDTDDMATYAAKYKKLQADKLKNGSPARFAKH